MLNKFQALLCPSSGVRDYMCVITAYMVWSALVAGCRRSGAEQQAMRPEWGIHSLLLCTWPPTSSNQGIAHHRR